MTTILAVDPGETSAYIMTKIHALPAPAAGPTGPAGPATTSPSGPGRYELLTAGSWKGMDQLSLVIEAVFRQANILVVEDYRVYPHKTQSHVGSRVYTLREIGRIEWIGHVFGIPIHFQMAAEAKKQWPNARFKRHLPDLYAQTKGKGHIRDAARHLFTYMENHKPPLYRFFKMEDAI